jgi:cytoskeletal protein CcmA (bactofilin family)
MKNLKDTLKSKLQSAKSAPGQLPKDAPSILSADLYIVANIETDGDVHVEGRLGGNVNCQTLTLGCSGHIKGRVNCENAKIHGNLVGSLAANNVELMETANVVGDVSHEKLRVETGATINGFYKNIDSAKLADQKVKALSGGKPLSRPNVERPKRSNLRKKPGSPKYLETPASQNSNDKTVH